MLTLYHGAHRWKGPPRLRPAGKGKSEHGSGLYLTTSPEEAVRYAKGGGSVLRFHIDSTLVFSDAVKLDVSEMHRFLDENKVRHRARVRQDLDAWVRRTGSAEVPSYVLENLLANNDALKGAIGPALARFFVEHGIDASLVTWSDKDWLVLYNLDKIESYERVKIKGSEVETRISR